MKHNRKRSLAATPKIAECGAMRFGGIVLTILSRYMRSRVTSARLRRNLLIMGLLVVYTSPVFAATLSTLDPWPRNAIAATCSQPWWNGNVLGGYAVSQQLSWTGNGTGCMSPSVGAGHFYFVQYASPPIYYQQHANDRTWECGTARWNSNPQAYNESGLVTTSSWEDYGISCNLQADTNMQWYSGGNSVWHYQYF